MKVGISYDEEHEEECNRPDKDIVFIDSKDKDGKERKKKFRRKDIGSGLNVMAHKSDKVEKKKGRKIDEIDVDGERMFRCGEDGCDYKTKMASSVRVHKAMIHDIGITCYLCGGEDGCDYKAKQASNVKVHKAAIHNTDCYVLLVWGS